MTESFTLLAQLDQAQLPVHSAQGLDVSNYQGRFNWAATQGLTFGIHRLTQGGPASHENSPDPTAAWNHAQIADRGLHRGAYHFLDPQLPGAVQARYFADQAAKLGPIKPADMFWLDNEWAHGCSPQMVAECARDFMAELHRLLPHNPMGVYTFISFATGGYCAGLSQWPLWLAHPGLAAPAPPPPWARWLFWQWGTRDGTDADAFNGTAADLDDWIKSYAPDPPHGPYRHVADGTQSYAEIAAERHTTVKHIAEVTANAMAAHAHQKITKGDIYYTSKP